MRKLVVLLAGLIFTIHLTSCTSKDSKDEGMGDEAVAESTAGTDGDLAASSDSAAPTDGTNDGFLDEQLPEDALGETDKPADSSATADASAATDTQNQGEQDLNAPPADANAMGDMADTAPPPAIDSAPAPTDSAATTDSTTPPADATATTDTAPTDNSMAAVDTGTSPTDTSSTGTVASSDMPSDSTPAPVESKPKASLKKIEAAPFNRSGILLNAVYVARPKDTYSKISKMIYGDSKKTKELKKVNPYVHTPHPGDKIYYNSPMRPTDDTKLLTFYEDSGMSPEVYVAKDGDNIRKLGKTLLGYSNGWKELWATNPVDSKGALAAGTELRYWKTAPVAAPPPAMPTNDIAANAPPPDAQPMPEAAPPAAAQNELPPPPPAEMTPPPPPPAQGEMAPPPPPTAQNDLPPPPPPAEMAPPPPPPPPAEAVNPPPPPPMPKKAPKDLAASEGGMDNDMLMTLGGAGILLAGIAALIAIRRRRQSKEMASAFNDTQVGT